MLEPLLAPGTSALMKTETHHPNLGLEIRGYGGFLRVLQGLERLRDAERQGRRNMQSVSILDDVQMMPLVLCGSLYLDET